MLISFGQMWEHEPVVSAALTRILKFDLVFLCAPGGICSIARATKSMDTAANAHMVGLSSGRADGVQCVLDVGDVRQWTWTPIPFEVEPACQRRRRVFVDVNNVDAVDTNGG